MTYTYLDLIEEVLLENGKPMTISQIWEYASERGLSKKLSSIGKTMNAQLHKNMLRGDNARFKQISNKPALFNLI